jgi:putative transcriptional regulator
MSESLRGQCLIAAKRLRDRNFYKTVVLMVEHGSDGAMGLVVNRPSSVTVAHALSEHFKLPETDDLVYVGGPVEPSALFILHNSVEFDHNESPVIPGVFVGSSAEIFEQIVRSSAEGNPDLRFRIYSGCAGWGPGQLEGELARGDWHSHPVEGPAIFTDDPYSVWEQMMAKVYASHRILQQPGANPEWN